MKKQKNPGANPFKDFWRLISPQDLLSRAGTVMIRINAGLAAAREGSKIKHRDLFCSGRFRKNILLGLPVYKKGHKRCSYGHWFVI